MRDFVFFAKINVMQNNSDVQGHYNDGSCIIKMQEVGVSFFRYYFEIDFSV